MARKRDILRDLIETTARLPWWVGVILAILSFVLMRWLATPTALAGGAGGPPTTVAASAITRGLALAGQVLFPLVFLVGAGFSLIQKLGAGRDADLDATRAASSTPKIARASDPHVEHDLYTEWKNAGNEGLECPAVDTSRWSSELIQALEWKRFEYLCAGYFENLGFRAETARAGADGGVDIHLFEEGAVKPGIIVQCKAWRTYKIGVKPIREMFGVMAADNIHEGIFVTTSTFTNDARNFATGRNIHLIDGREFLAKLNALPPKQQQDLLCEATDGDFTTPTCPSCGVKMTLRAPKAGGDPFWGCRNFPGCRTTLPRAVARVDS